MTLDDVHAVLNFIADTDAKCADNIFVALTLLSDTMTGLKRSAQAQAIQTIETSAYSELDAFKKYLTDIDILIAEVDMCCQVMVREKPTPESTPNPEPTADPKPSVNYSLYEVDRLEKHRLGEDFEYKRVCGFSFDGEYYDVRSWRDMMAKLCGILYRKHKKQFAQLMSDQRFQGKKRAFLSWQNVRSETGAELYSPIEGSDMFVYTKASANSMCSSMLKLLNALGLGENALWVFLRADYSELHGGADDGE